MKTLIFGMNQLINQRRSLVRPGSFLGLIAEASIPEEPGAGKLHAGICAGAVGQLAVLPRWLTFVGTSITR